MLRQEFKFFIKSEDVFFIKKELRYLLIIDKNCKNYNPYTITSIYFDNAKDEDLFEKLNGVRYREKYRLRFYDKDEELIKFEIKRKHENTIEKNVIKINQKGFINMLDGDFSCLKQYKEFEYLFYKMKYKLYKPKTVVRYDRLAFQLPFNNIRVTLDLNLRSSTFFNSYREKDITAGKKIMPIGYEILEIKFSNSFPDYLYKILSKYSLKRSSISKYSSARLFNNPELNNDNPELPF